MTLSQRTILTGAPAERNDLWKLLAGVVIAELTDPSEELWVVSPWISDIPLLDDSAGRFHAINESGKASLSLIDVLTSLARRGSVVTVVTRAHESRAFLRALENRAGHRGESVVKVVIREELHAKGWATAEYCIWGSMNFTFSGLGKWDELVTFQTGQGASELLSLFRAQYADGQGT